MPTIEWNVKNALNRDVERQHLNKILADISASFAAINKSSNGSASGNVKDIVGEMVEGNSESGISVTYDFLNKVLNFAVSSFVLRLVGDVTGTVTLTPGGAATMTTTIDPSKVGIPDCPNDGTAYWRRFGLWEDVGSNLEEIRLLTGSGFPAANFDVGTELSAWNMRTIEGTTLQIDVADGDGALGNPTISLSDLPDNGTGTLLAIDRDAKGRVEGTRIPDPDDFPPELAIYLVDEFGNYLLDDDGNLILTDNYVDSIIDLAQTGTGIVAHTAAEDWEARTLQGPMTVVVTNGSGVAGDPSFALVNDEVNPGSLESYATNMSGTKGWYKPALFESTGLLDGGTLSINAGDNTKFDVAAAIVGQTDYNTNPAAPTRTVLSVGPFVAQSVPSLAVIATYVGIQMPGGTIVTQNSPYTATQTRTIAPLGAVISNGVNLIAVNNLPNVMRAGINQIGDLMQAIGPMNISGNRISANGVNLQINKSAGTLFKQGANFAIDHANPHGLSLAALTAANFNYRLSDGTQFATTNVVDPNNYESPLGTLGPIPAANRFTIQRFNLFTSNLIRVQYGQFVYNTMAEAEASLATESFTTETNIAENGILLCFLIVQDGATDLSDGAQAKFIPASKFGGPVGSGGTSITNTDALPEGATNLYFTDTRARNAVIAVSVTNGDTTHSPSGDAVFDYLTANYQPLDADLTAVAALGSTGFATRTAANTWAQRSFANGTGFTWTNPAGIAGDPTLVLNANLQAWSAIATSTKEPAITAGTNAQFWRGDKAFTNNLRGPYESQVGTLAAGVTAPVLNMLTDNAAGTAAIKVLRGPTSNSSGIVFAPTNAGVQTDFVFLSHDGMMGIGAAPVSLPFELTGTGSASTGWLVGTAFNSLGFTPTLRVEFNDTVAIASGSFVRYGNNVNSGFVLGYKARGTGAAPSQVLSGDSLMAVRGGGWHSGGAFGNAQAGEVAISAAEDFTSTAQGTRVRIRTAALGTTSATDKFTVDANGDCFLTGGRLYGTALHNNATALTGTTNQYVGSGTYTPTGTGLTNVTTVTPNAAQWMRVGNVVTVSGSVAVTPTAAAPTKTIFNLTLPIASNMTGTNQCGGGGGRNLAAQIESAIVLGDTVNDQATVTFMATSTGSATLYYSYQYLIL